MRCPAAGFFISSFKAPKISVERSNRPSRTCSNDLIDLTLGPIIFYYDLAMTNLERWDWVNLGDAEGRVDRPSAGLAWSAPPEVELDDQWLVFPYPVRVLR